MRSSVNLIPLLALFAGLMASVSASADERYQFYRITCAPEFHHFSLESASFGNSLGDWLFALPPESGDIEQAAQDRAHQQKIADRLGYMEKQYGLYSPGGRLTTHPFECEPMSGIKIEVSATAHPPSAEQCAGNGYDAIHITVNGRLVDTLGQVSACDLRQEISVLVNELSYQVCTSEVHEGVLSAAPNESTFESECKSLPISNLRQN